MGDRERAQQERLADRLHVDVENLVNGGFHVSYIIGIGKRFPQMLGDQTLVFGIGADGPLERHFEAVMRLPVQAVFKVLKIPVAARACENIAKKSRLGLLESFRRSVMFPPDLAAKFHTELDEASVDDWAGKAVKPLPQQIFQLNLRVRLAVAILHNHRSVERNTPLLAVPMGDRAGARDHYRALRNH